MQWFIILMYRNFFKHNNNILYTKIHTFLVDVLYICMRIAILISDYFLLL